MCATKCGASTVSPYFHLFDKYISNYTSRDSDNAQARPRSSVLTFVNTRRKRRVPREPAARGPCISYGYSAAISASMTACASGPFQSAPPISRAISSPSRFRTPSPAAPARPSRGRARPRVEPASPAPRRRPPRRSARSPRGCCARSRSAITSNSSPPPACSAASEVSPRGRARTRSPRSSPAAALPSSRPASSRAARGDEGHVRRRDGGRGPRACACRRAAPRLARALGAGSQASAGWRARERGV